MEKSTERKAIIIGDINVDIITPPFDPSVLVKAETSCVLDKFTMSLGGNAANVAAELAALKDPHLFMGGMGDCGISQWIENQCSILEIETAFGKIKNQTAGITFALTYEDGRRQFIATLGTNKLVRPSHLDLSFLDDSVGHHISRSGFWYTPGLRGKPTIDIFKRNLQNGGQTSLDVGWDPDNFSKDSVKVLYDTLNYTQFFFANEIELKAITKKDKIEDAYEEILAISSYLDDPILVVHRGSQGSAIVSRNSRAFIPAFKLDQMVNPTGTGDIYNAGFIHGLLQKWEYKDCARFAGKLAAIHLNDINKIYPTLNDYKSSKL